MVPPDRPERAAGVNLDLKGKISENEVQVAPWRHLHLVFGIDSDYVVILINFVGPPLAETISGNTPGAGFRPASRAQNKIYLAEPPGDNIHLRRFH